jgi:hypothetical protein
MGELPATIRADLARTLGRLRFADRCPDTQYGRHWTVSVHPWQRKDGRFDALLQLAPSSARLACDGWLTMVKHNGHFYLPTGPTNARGQAWFVDLPPGRYGPAFAQAPGATRGHSPRPTAPVLYRFDGERGQMTLGREGRGAFLAVNLSGSPGIRKPCLRFALGQESGHIPLSHVEAQWTGRHRLKQPFAQAAAHVPAVAVEG